MVKFWQLLFSISVLCPFIFLSWLAMDMNPDEPFLEMMGFVIFLIFIGVILSIASYFHLTFDYKGPKYTANGKRIQST